MPRRVAVKLLPETSSMDIAFLEPAAVSFRTLMPVPVLLISTRTPMPAPWIRLRMSPRVWAEERSMFRDWPRLLMRMVPREPVTPVSDAMGEDQLSLALAYWPRAEVAEKLKGVEPTRPRSWPVTPEVRS